MATTLGGSHIRPIDTDTVCAVITLSGAACRSRHITLPHAVWRVIGNGTHIAAHMNHRR